MRKDKIINIGIYIYIVLFIFYSFSGRIIPVSLFIGNRANSLIYAFFAGVGCMLVFCDFIVSRKVIKSRYFFVLCLFVVAMILSSLINIDLGYVENIKTIVWTVIQITIFYSLYLRIEKKYIKEILIYIFAFICIIWTVAVIISLVQFVIQDAYMYDITGVGYKYQGFYGGRLFGIFNDPNFAAVTSAYVVFMLIYIYTKMKKNWCKRVIVWSAMVFNVLYVILSGSRTVLVAFAGSSFVYLFLCLKNRFLNSNYKFWLSGIGAIVGVIIVFSVSVPIKAIVTVFPEYYMEHFSREIGHMRQDKILMALLRERDDVLLYWQESPLEQRHKEVQDNSEKEEAVDGGNVQKTAIAGNEENHSTEILEREDVKTNGLSNNRVEIWREYIKGIKGRYIVGTSPRNMLAYLEKTGTAEFVLYRQYETHNGYLSVLIGCGIVGCIPVLMLAFLMGKNILKYCFGNKQIEFEFITLFSIIILILIYTFFFTELFFVNNLTTALFWSGLGMLWLWIEKC